MKILSLLLLLTLFVSCSNNQPLCDCVEAGEDVNKISASFFNRAPTQAGEDSLNSAKAKYDSLCAPFQEMSPAELHKRAAECQSLEINPDL
ncbi:hypothetical protein [Brumimicrobium oceani]|uniref:Lipoprotein n=1 Tax=Brumimicrobium oceani TaxID=2100725 RepID=A0A2U2XCV7_9FLAO|nr:hypothetical protein [Brumimicrobium oceani]PWH85541.1 hypothetical protein DIT68_07840 [Brumimicrobium oceani]